MLIKKTNTVDKTENNYSNDKYAVLLYNDDYTPMDFVVNILTRFFYYKYEDAVSMMYAIHNTGKKVCGIYSYDVAVTICYRVQKEARKFLYPLRCAIKKEENNDF